MTNRIRVPPDIFDKIRQIRISLEGEYKTATPSFQDFANVALSELIEAWENPDSQKRILSKLLARRKNARSRMGNQPKSTPKTSKN